MRPDELERRLQERLDALGPAPRAELLHVPDSKPTMRLRDVKLADEQLYERLRCDPVMMAELGGPQPREEIPDKVRRDVASVETDEGWISVIETEDGEDAGSICIWQHDDRGETLSEIGWMVLREFQGRGLGKAATAAILDRAAVDGRWGDVHAFPAVTNAPSNGICRSLGFTLLGTVDDDWDGRIVTENHWVIDPAERLARA
jgi:RimJ/RimL family protein N-acetyltransferase